MARLILVRHGQTAWNVEERFRGRIDLPLNEVGVWQATRAAEAIEERYEVSAVYSSPLSRTMRTAEPIAEAFGIDVRSLPGIIDFTYGEWEGKTPGEVEAAWPEEYRLWLTQPHRMKIPGGESLRAARARISAAVERVADAHPDEAFVLVTHRMVCKVMVAYLLGLDNSDLWRVELDTASISIFERRDPGWVTLLLNDTCHLQEAPVS